MDSYYRGRFDRVNQDEVPESKHTIFIRGLPGYVKTDEVKDFFEDHIGPCSFDFIKISPDQLKLFVAVRFETREAAKECMNRYRDNDVLGHPVELTWFKDIRRYVSYQQSQGLRTTTTSRSRYGSSRGQTMSSRSSYERSSRNDHRDNDDVAKKSSSLKERRSLSKSSSSPASHSPRDSSREGSSSLSSHRSKECRKLSHHSSNASVSPMNAHSTISPTVQQVSSKPKIEADDKVLAVPLPPSPLRVVGSLSSQRQIGVQDMKSKSSSPTAEKKLRKTKKDKKKRRKRSPSSSYTSSDDNHSSGDLTEEELRKKILKKRQRTLRAGTEGEMKLDEEKLSGNLDFVGSRSGAVTLKNTTLKFGLESSDEVPRKIVKDSLVNVPLVKVGTPKSAGDMTVRCTNTETSDATAIEATEGKPENAASGLSLSAPVVNDPDVLVGKRSNPNIASTSRYFDDFGLHVKFGSLRGEPSLPTKRSHVDELDESVQPSGLRLSSFTRQMTAESERESKLARLPPELLAKFVAKKKQFDMALKADCETFAFVVKLLIQKDPGLEGRLRVALGEVVKDVEDKFSEKIDEYLDQVVKFFESV